MQLRNAKATATASTSSTGDLTSRTKGSRRAAQIDSTENSEHDSDSEPKNVYWSPSKSRQSKIFDEYFEKNQYPSKIEMEQLAKKACVSLQCVQSNFSDRRKRARKMVASGARKELPTQMKRLNQVVTDKGVKYYSQSDLRLYKIFDEFFERIQFPSKAEIRQLAEQTGVSFGRVRSHIQKRRMRARQMVASGARKELPTQMKRLREVLKDWSLKFYDKKELADLKKELNIDDYQLQNFLRAESFSCLHATSHRELMARTQFPSFEQFKEEAQKTKRSVPEVRKWFDRNRRNILKEFRSGKRKELPHQMKTLHEVYMEKQDITEKQMKQLSEKLRIRPHNIPTFFNLMRQMERKVGEKGIAEKNVPRQRSEKDSEEESEDEDDEDSPSDSESSNKSGDEGSEDEDEEDVEKNSQPCSFSYVSRNSRAATKSSQRIEAEENESSDCDDYNPPSPQRASSDMRDHASLTTKGRSRSHLVSRQIEEDEDESSDCDDKESPRKKRTTGRRQMKRVREDEEEFDEMAQDWELPPPNGSVGRSQGQTPDYDYNPLSPVSSDVRDHASSTSKRVSRSSLFSRRIEEEEEEEYDRVRSSSPMPLTVDTSSAPNGRLQRQLSAPRFRFPHPSRRGQTRRWRSRMTQAVESYSKKLIKKQLSVFMRNFQQDPGTSSFLNSRRQNEETTHTSRKRVEEDESENEDSEDGVSLARNQKPASKSRRRIEEEEDESSGDDDKEPPRKKRPAGRRQMGRIGEDEDFEDEMAEDWELPPPNQRHGRSRDQTQDIDYDHRSRVTRGVSRPSSFSRRRDQEGSRKSSRYVSSMETNEWLRDVFSGLSETRVKIHGRKFKDVVLPFDHSVDWENWSSEQTVQVATQLFPPRAVEFFKKSGVHSKVLYLFTHKIPGFFEGLEEHNEGGHFTREMFDKFGDNIRKIDELMKEKAAGTSSNSRSGYVESSSSSSTASSSSSSPDEVFKAPSSSAPENPPAYVLHTTLVGLPGQKQRSPAFLQERRFKICGPEFKDIPLPFNFSYVVSEWTDAHFLEFASQFVPTESLAVLKKWGLTRSTVSGFTKKNERSFRKLKDLDLKINKKETFTRGMFEQFGFYIREIQIIEQKRRREDLPRSRTSSIMSDSLNFWKSKDRCTPPRRDEFKEEVMEQEEEEEERAPATVLFTPGRSRK